MTSRYRDLDQRYWNVHQRCAVSNLSGFPSFVNSANHRNSARRSIDAIERGSKLPRFTNRDWTSNSGEQSAKPFTFVTRWIVFHCWIIYIGKGCIYSPFLIEHPQPLRLLSRQCSAILRALKPSTKANLGTCFVWVEFCTYEIISVISHKLPESILERCKGVETIFRRLRIFVNSKVISCATTSIKLTKIRTSN